jgi:hypothetical protein
MVELGVTRLRARVCQPVLLTHLQLSFKVSLETLNTLSSLCMPDKSTSFGDMATRTSIVNGCRVVT